MRISNKNEDLLFAQVMKYIEAQYPLFTCSDIDTETSETLKDLLGLTFAWI
jgi:hypothetical protein